MKILNRKNIFLDNAGLQDVLFLVGIFVFISILIIGFFPDKNFDIVINQDFFTYTIMLVPVIAAIYFIIISFRRNLYTESAEIASSIRKKITIAFVVVAILPSLPIMLVANYLINQTMSNLIFTRTSQAFDEAMSLSQDSVRGMSDRLRGEIDSLRFLVAAGGMETASPAGRERIRALYKLKNIPVRFYRFAPGRDRNTLVPLDGTADNTWAAISHFYSFIDFPASSRLDRISLRSGEYLLGALATGGTLVVLTEKIPEALVRRIALFRSSLADYRRLDSLKNVITGDAEVFLLSLSIIVIIISVLVSLYLSKSITRPVLELSEAARQIAAGDFSVQLHRPSEDELGVLFTSFNAMIRQLEQNRKMAYQKQRLEAWRGMARRVVHEIKNPLTPIRLSAERMQRRYMEKHPDIENIILTGTETIIEEVEVLMNILSEFTKFARLPEMKPVKVNINPLLENCLILFSAHERIEFDISMDETIPEIFIDKVLIWQAMTNLIQNAVDSIQGKGFINIESKLVRGAEGEIVRITIADSGSGIRPADLDRIFEPGFSTKQSGTGLGLAIVEKIVLEHHGVVYCNSTVGVGTTFFIDLPVEKNREIAYG